MSEIALIVFDLAGSLAPSPTSNMAVGWSHASCVSETAVVAVLVLARSLARSPKSHTTVATSHNYIRHNELISPVHHPTAERERLLQ